MPSITGGAKEPVEWPLWTDQSEVKVAMARPTHWGITRILRVEVVVERDYRSDL
jgi:hypothetical protein